MENKAAALAAAFGLLSLSACSGLNITDQGRSFNKGDVAQKLYDAGSAMSAMMQAETKLGREAAANSVARYGIDEDEALQRYVRLVGLACARKAKRTDVKWRFIVLKTREANAFAAPGGYVFVTHGLVKMLDDEAELAGVLAHEIGHIDEKHAMKGIRVAGTAEAAATLLGDQALYRAATKRLIALLDRGLERSDELSADRYGTAALAKVGYDTTGLARALERHAEKTGDRGDDNFNRRHPPLDARIKNLDAMKMEEKGLALASRFKQYVR